MKIVVDDKIPYIRPALEALADTVVYRPGASINADDVRDADALVVRTRTRCDERLLGQSAVKFIATATIGYDHIDSRYLRKAGIEWINCPGCNADSVAQYVRSVLILLKRYKGRNLRTMKIGVVGCGHVGSRVVKAALDEGMEVLMCDPPLQEAGAAGTYVSMDTIERECDVITFHVPLTKDGRHATHHMADKDFFDRLAKKPVIINTSRGPVVDNNALKNAIIYNKVSETIIDTWENEPSIDTQLLDLVWIGTPHIAGYSADGKANADNMVIEGLCRHFKINNRWHIEPPQLPADFPMSSDQDTMRLNLYNPMTDCERLRKAPWQFEKQRGDYPLRREKPNPRQTVEHNV